MQEKLFDSEAKVMEILWERGPLSAKEISLVAAESIGWNKNAEKRRFPTFFVLLPDPAFRLRAHCRKVFC